MHEPNPPSAYGFGGELGFDPLKPVHPTFVVRAQVTSTAFVTLVAFAASLVVRSSSISAPESRSVASASGLPGLYAPALIEKAIELQLLLLHLAQL